MAANGLGAKSGFFCAWGTEGSQSRFLVLKYLEDRVEPNQLFPLFL